MFLDCVLYFAVLGIASFFLGRLLPKSWFRADCFPYRCYDFEKQLYQKLRVREWQDKVPDMSRILPMFMPPKRLTKGYQQRLPLMIQETCVAEFIHGTLILAGFACLKIWPGIGGEIMTTAYILLGNLPFIIIQRYNRPRLSRLLVKQEERTFLAEREPA